jgi:anthranilate phosphoribosyltransferase
VLEHLGVAIDLPAETMMEILEETGIAFLFAPIYHSSMKYAAPVRKEIGVRTIFNILGPLLNPARATMEVMGVYQKELVTPLAQVLQNLGVKNGIVIHGSDGLDEATISGETVYCAIGDGKLTEGTFVPENFGLSRAPLSAVIGGTPEENAGITRAILSGKETGPKRDIVVLNSALALYVGGKAGSIGEGAALAQELIDSGKAAEKLEQLCKATKEKKEALS